MSLPHDPLWPRAGGWAGPAAGRTADVAIVGVPTHRTSLSPTQAHLTPAAVREALRRYSLETHLTIVDAGDAVDPDDPTAEKRAIEWIASIEAGLVVAIGGDNAATVPVALGRGARGLVTVDAHHDLRDGVSNGSPVRRLVEAGMAGSAITQLGIEPLANSHAYRQRAQDLGIRVVERADLVGRPIAQVMRDAIDRAAALGPVHVDLDVDACDRSVAPACPASVPGGLSAGELRTAARVAGAHPAVVSIDLTEVDATADAPDGRTVRLVALCVLEAITGMASR